MKNLKINKVNFLQPVRINFRGTSRPEHFVTSNMVDTLEFANATWLCIVNRGQRVFVPIYNIMSVEAEGDDTE
jgi:hypothetical protein